MSAAIGSARPEREHDEAVYSNFDHALDDAVVSALEVDPGLCAQHAAWDFCGYVWRGDDGVWRDEVWRWNLPVEVFEGESARAVIEAANESYGDG